jgi:hypothetical protein
MVLLAMTLIRLLKEYFENILFSSGVVVTGKAKKNISAIFWYFCIVN